MVEKLKFISKSNLKIDKTINLDNGLSIIRMDVFADKHMLESESNYIGRYPNVVW